MNPPTERSDHRAGFRWEPWAAALVVLLLLITIWDALAGHPNALI